MILASTIASITNDAISGCAPRVERFLTWIRSDLENQWPFLESDSLCVGSLVTGTPVITDAKNRDGVRCFADIRENTTADITHCRVVQITSQNSGFPLVPGSQPFHQPFHRRQRHEDGQSINQGAIVRLKDAKKCCEMDMIMYAGLEKES